MKSRGGGGGGGGGGVGGCAVGLWPNTGAYPECAGGGC